MKHYINLGKEKLDVNQFITKVKNYDVELTRNEIIDVINNAEKNSPSDVPTILSAIKNTYHINMAL